MIGQMLCRLGWHRWQYQTTVSKPSQKVPCYVSTTTRRCRRACERFDDWIVWSQSSSW